MKFLRYHIIYIVIAESVARMKIGEPKHKKSERRDLLWEKRENNSVLNLNKMLLIITILLVS